MRVCVCECERGEVKEETHFSDAGSNGGQTVVAACS